MIRIFHSLFAHDSQIQHHIKANMNSSVQTHTNTHISLVTLFRDVPQDVVVSAGGGRSESAELFEINITSIVLLYSLCFINHCTLLDKFASINHSKYEKGCIIQP